MRFFLVLAVLLSAAAPAAAQDMLRDHRSEDPTAKLLDDYQAPETIEDYANLYYDSCTRSNVDASLTEYVETQCACTAAEMPKFMTLKNMKSLFTRSQEGDFQEGRVMLLAYIPCLYTSINQFVFDGCFYSDEMRQKTKRPRKVCECYGHRMGDFMSAHGQNLVPGFMRDTFISDKSVPNPLAYIIGAEFFEREARYHFSECIMSEEHRFDK